jgi:monoterpene epsilon-lactone hydrolase
MDTTGSLESAPLAKVLAFLDAHRPTERSLAALRRYMDEMLAMEPVGQDVKVEAVTLGGVPAEKLVAPSAGDDGSALLYLHGGGYSLGSAAGYRPLGARLARSFGGPLYMLDYRLAPEHRYPAGLEDALAAYRGLLALGISPQKITLGGDSAGGGLAVALCLRLRDEEDPLPAGLGLLSPWVDLEGNTRSMLTLGPSDPIVTRDGMLGLAEMYIGPTGDRKDPLAAPIHADLRRLPPMIVHVGTRETQLDQAVAFAQRAREAGVCVDEHVWPEMVHVFQMFPAFPEAQASIDEIGACLRSAVDNPRPRSE